jgi:hypothetical protein
MPVGFGERNVWVSWHDRDGPLPAIAGSLSARVPWPRELPVGVCRLDVHPPQRYRVEGHAPLTEISANGREERLPASLTISQAEDQAPLRHTVMDVSPIPEPGRPFAPGASLRVIYEPARNFGLALAIVVPVALLVWWAAAFWHRFVQHETVCWLVLAVFWWMCLAPSCLGLLIGAWAATCAVRRRHEPAAAAMTTGQIDQAL